MRTTPKSTQERLAAAELIARGAEELTVGANVTGVRAWLIDAGIAFEDDATYRSLAGRAASEIRRLARELAVASEPPKKPVVEREIARVHELEAELDEAVERYGVRAGFFI